MEKNSKLAILSLLLNSSLTIMVGSVIAPALPSISENLNFKFNPGLLVTLPSLGVVLFAPLIGKLINKLGPHRLLMLGLIPYAILGSIGFYLENNWLLILDRILLGGACVAIQVSVTTYIAELFTDKKRLQMIAAQGMAIELGGVIFLSLGGYLGELNWRFPFFIYLIALISFFISMASLPKKTIVVKEDYNSEKNVSLPIIPIILIGSFFSMALFFVCYVNLPLALPNKFNFTESETGYFMSFISLIAVVVAGLLPKVCRFVKEQNVLISGFIFFSIGYFIFSLATNIPIMIIGATFIGLGFGFTVPLLNHMIISFSNVTNRGKNLSYYSMMIFSGQFAATFTNIFPSTSAKIFGFTGIIGLIIVIFLCISFNKIKEKPL